MQVGQTIRLLYSLFRDFASLCQAGKQAFNKDVRLESLTYIPFRALFHGEAVNLS